MKTSNEGIKLIKSFEGCRLYAYKPVPTEKYYTIGYGHYGSDVRSGMIITQKQAEDMLVNDLVKYENYVNTTGLKLNQNQFDALVSFTYNCGNGNLKKLISGRTIPQISNALLLYNKSGGKVLAGLTRRRKAEKALFDKVQASEGDSYYPKYTGSSTSIVAALQAVKVDSNYTFRKKIAETNGIKGYSGTAEQNTTMLNLLKQGKLKRV